MDHQTEEEPDESIPLSREAYFALVRERRRARMERVLAEEEQQRMIDERANIRKRGLLC